MPFAFLQALALLGWTIGRNVRIETRWAAANAAEIRRHAMELAEHAIDWALMHGTDAKYTVFSKLTGGDVAGTYYTVQDPTTIDEIVPKDNRTQIGIAQQRKASFLVRFIISYNNDKDRHHLMVEYPGVAPKDLFGKVFWGSLQEIGDTPPR